MYSVEFLVSKVRLRKTLLLKVVYIIQYNFSASEVTTLWRYANMFIIIIIIITVCIVNRLKEIICYDSQLQ